MKKYKILTTLLLIFSLFLLCSFTSNAKEVNQKSSSQSENWKLILENIDIDVKYLEPNKYLGLYWDSYVEGNNKESYLYLCWTSTYYTRTDNTILYLSESNKSYYLYSSNEDMKNKRGNWLSSTVQTYPEYDLSIYMTPIAGIIDGQNFGLPLKRTYTFTNLKFGYEGTNQAIGQCKETMTFDLGLVPKQDGKNSMQLCTHGYEIIETCEAQSYFDLLKYGGYGHFVHFNTKIKIDKIYRVDVAYKVVNDDKPWYQFFLPSDEHQIKKSLTAERVSGGIFGLYKFQGFTEGSFQSTISSSINYKYRLHLNYDDDSWNIFEGKEYYESDYRRISQFQILRMNYVIDGETYDVPIKMDTIEGETLFILDPKLILDTQNSYYKVKKQIDDFILGLKDKLQSKMWILWTIIGVVVFIILVVIIVKIRNFIRLIFPKKEKE
ncbi:MAG TPA: hypothetical protein PKV66_00700 [Candidatus Pelethenecus sp.]|nr:hypothetical protein [Candidatus Pelethenecus sp.]